MPWNGILQVNDSWARIADATGIPVVECKKKKESLMASFQMHLRKKKASIKSGAREEEVYKPIWLFYEALEFFLKDIYECKSIVTTEEEVSKTKTYYT